MKITEVAPWFGSNRMLANNVGNLVGKRAWVGVPFAGGMSELAHIQGRTIVANDLHLEVINLARVMADPVLGPKLYRALRRLPFHPDVLRDAQSRCETMRIHNEIAGTNQLFVSDKPVMKGPILQWAIDYFVSAWMSRNSEAGKKREFEAGMSVRWNASGGDSAVRVHSAVGGLLAWRKCFRNTTFTTMDALKFIGECHDEEDHAIYCDPPFPGPGDAYLHRVDAEFQSNLASAVVAFKKTRIVMRFYDVPFIRALYPTTEWAWNIYAGRKQTNEAAPEVILTRN